LQLSCSSLAHLYIEAQICVCMCVWVYERGQPSCSSWSAHSFKFVCPGVHWEKKDKIKGSSGACWMLCVCFLWGRNIAPCLTAKSSWVHHHKAVCFVCKAEQCFAACLPSYCPFIHENPNVCVCLILCVWVYEGGQPSCSSWSAH